MACHAPFASMYLDQHGFVRACCMNEAHVLGNIRSTPLSEIWHGERAGRLRRAMEVGDLGLGCDFCRWPVENGRADLAFSRWFAELPVEAADPEWPRQLEFSITNTCNLQCVMCNGEWSSSIRSQREGLEPLPKVYGEDFFADLAALLPHLHRVKFLGGEPFLAGETLRIMEMLVDAGATPSCHATTNGTQWSPRVERILDLLPVDVAVSLDAATAATYEGIRVGSSWSTVRTNLDRFRARARERGTHVSITMCLMTANWREFADFCLLADELEVSCDVNTVTQPTPLSLYHLPAHELEEVVAGLEADDRRVGDRLGWSRATWKGELDRLRSHLADRRAGISVMGIDEAQAAQVTVRPWDRGDEQRRQAETAEDVEAVARAEAEAAAAGARRWAEAVERSAQRRLDAVGADADRVRLDHSDLVMDAAPTVLGVDGQVLVGRPAPSLMELFSERLSPVVAVEQGPAAEDDRTLEVRLEDGRRIRVFTTPAYEDDGRRVGTEVHLAWGAEVGGG